MSYKIERKTRGNLGEIVEISADEKFFSQAEVDGLLLRIHIDDKKYEGTLFKAGMEASEADHETFQTLVGRVNDLVGSNVSSGMDDYVKYLAKDYSWWTIPFAWSSPYPNPVITLRNKRRSFLPKSFNDYLSKRAYGAGWATALIGLGAAIATVTSSDLTIGAASSLPYYMLKVYAPAAIFPSSFALSYFPVKKYVENKILSPQFPIDRFIEAETKLNEFNSKPIKQGKAPKEKLKQEKKRAAAESILQSKLRESWTCLEESVKLLKERKGLTIKYEDEDLDKVYEFFGYLVSGKMPAQASQPEGEVEMEEEPETEQLEKVKLTDPWEVPMPTIGEVGR